MTVRTQGGGGTGQRKAESERENTRGTKNSNMYSGSYMMRHEAQNTYIYDLYHVILDYR